MKKNTINAPVKKIVLGLMIVFIVSGYGCDGCNGKDDKNNADSTTVQSVTPASVDSTHKDSSTPAFRSHDNKDTGKDAKNPRP